MGSNRLRKRAGKSGAFIKADRVSRDGGRFGSVVVLVLALLALTAGSALGKEVRVIDSSFGGGELSLSAHSGIAVNGATHNVYVADTGGGRIAEFKADGTPVRTFGTLASPTFIAVDNSGGGSQGAVYVADAGDNSVSKFTAAGAPEASWGTAGKLGGFGGIAGIAVNQGGTLYVLEENSTVQVFSSAGVAAPSFVAPRGTQSSGLAVDSEGNLYKIDGSPEVTKFDPTGATVADNLTGRSDGIGLSVNPGNDDLYVVNGNGGAPFVSVFAVNCGAANCTPKEAFGGGELVNAVAVTVDGGSGAIYVADEASGEVDSFGSPVTVPAVTVEAPTGVTGTKATLSGIVNPDGLAVTECKFEYGSTPTLGESKPCTGAIPTDEADHPVTAALTGLSAGSTYYFRLVTRNANGTNSSSQLNFVTPESAVTKPATDITATGATLNGAVFPEGEAVSQCFFEYGETESYGATMPCVGVTPADEAEHPVSATITGLTVGGTTYHFRLVVVRPSGEAIGLDQSFQTEGAVIAGEHVGEVGVSEATLEAEINPRGSQTKYRFEYGVTESYEAATPEAILGADEGFQVVAETLRGLAPESTYHWRVVAIDAFGEQTGYDRTFTTRGSPLGPETNCPNQVYRTGGPGSNLPDCRAYELVSPVDKNGSNIERGPRSVQAAANGERLTFIDSIGLPTTGGSGPLFVSSRNGGAWATNGLTPSTSSNDVAEKLGWDDELDATLSLARGGLIQGNISDGTYDAIIPQAHGQVFPAEYRESGSRFTFETSEALTPEAVAGLEYGEEANLYEYDHGGLSLVGLIPAGAATSCSGTSCVVASGGAFAGPYDWQAEYAGAETTTYGGATGFYFLENEMSSDGTRVIFTSGGRAQVYLREDGTRTTWVSAPQRSATDLHGERPAAFVGATPDDSRIFFLSCEKLTDDSTAVSTPTGTCNGPEDGRDLYEYDTDSGVLHDRSIDTRGNPFGADVIGFLGDSADGSDSYFVATGALTSDATAGSPNLYLAHEGQVSLVAKLSGQDNEDWLAYSKLRSEARWKNSRVAPNGTLLFKSVEELTGYSTAGCVGEFGQACAELYRFVPAEGKVRCVSCDPTGSQPAGSASLWNENTSALGQGLIEESFLSRNLSENGDEVFFDSPDSLVGADTNGVLDAYEWEADGSGSCHSTKVEGGCIYLLSTGTDPRPSYFGDASASGRDIFIFTRASLVPADKDELVDAYDVRSGGGFASQRQIVTPPCSGEACLGATSAPPAVESRGSSTFNGNGNESPKDQRCRKHHKSCKKREKIKHNRHHKKKKKKKHGKHEPAQKTRRGHGGSK